ncbi:hypothetical protein, partial [Vibrio harveyi]|uniref:hypothetical protein n=1 Tax=Vibrio harveyi TaxID=669 RepID=UPI001E48D22E
SQQCETKDTNVNKLEHQLSHQLSKMKGSLRLSFSVLLTIKFELFINNSSRLAPTVSHQKLSSRHGKTLRVKALTQ